MVLGSQQARSGANRSYLTRRRRGGKKRLLAVVLLLGIVGVAVWAMLSGGGDGAGEGATDSGPGTQLTGPTENPGPPDVLVQTPPPAPAPAPAPSPQPSPPAPAPGPAAGGPTVDKSPTTPPPTTATAASVADRIRLGRQLIQQNKLVAGRAALNAALAGPISRTDELAVKREMAAVNDKLVFSPLVEEGDPFTTVHVIQPGEYLSTLAPKYNTPWKFILRVNNIADARRVPAHARLKVVKGPFHCVVDKSDFRLDVYLAGPEGDMYVRSFPVGLGEYGSTPVGSFVVRRHSKLIDPEWVNPRTGERFVGSNPANPIGERWIGLQGTDSETELMRGYGIHGTIEPQSIGKESSMGCVRLLPADIELLYDMLLETKSKIVIQP